MIIDKTNLRQYLGKKVNTCGNNLDTGTLLFIYKWLKEYDPGKENGKKR